MRDTMTIRTPIPTGYGGVRHVSVTLPRVDFLIAEQPAKYALPESLPAPTDRKCHRGAARAGPAMTIPG